MKINRLAGAGLKGITGRLSGGLKLAFNKFANLNGPPCHHSWIYIPDTNFVFLLAGRVRVGNQGISSSVFQRDWPLVAVVDAEDLSMTVWSQQVEICPFADRLDVKIDRLAGAGL